MPYALAQKKHNWDAAWHLFVVGATLEELSGQLGIPYGACVAYSKTHQWSERRVRAREFTSKALREDVARRIESGRVKHQNFVMDQLDESQEHIQELVVKKQTDSIFAIGMPLSHKLGILKQHDDLARKTYKLDDITEHDPIRQGFQLLVALQPNKNLVNEQIEEIEGETLVSSSQMDFASEADGRSESTSQGASFCNTQLPPAGNHILGNVVELGPDFVPVKPLETTPSGMEVLPDDSEAFTGILSPLNGHINGMEEAGKGPGGDNSPEPGQEKTVNEKTTQQWVSGTRDKYMRENKKRREATRPASAEQIQAGIKKLPKNLY